MGYKKQGQLNLIIFVALISNLLFADTDWRKYGWQIFDNAGDGRLIAMGNSSVADVHINSTLWNPAIIGIGNFSNFTYGHQSRFAGIVQSDFFIISIFNKNRKSI